MNSFFLPLFAMLPILASCDGNRTPPKDSSSAEQPVRSDAVVPVDADASETFPERPHPRNLEEKVEGHATY